MARLPTTKLERETKRAQEGSSSRKSSPPELGGHRILPRNSRSRCIRAQCTRKLQGWSLGSPTWTGQIRKWELRTILEALRQHRLQQEPPLSHELFEEKNKIFEQAQESETQTVGSYRPLKGILLSLRPEAAETPAQNFTT